MGQVKGKVKVSDPTSEASRGGARNPPPPPRRGVAGAAGGGGDPDDDGEGSGRRPDESRNGTRDARCTPQPEDHYDAENDEQLNFFSRVMANRWGQQTRVPPEPHTLFKREKYLDIGMWLLTCTDFVGRNRWQ